MSARLPARARGREGEVVAAFLRLRSDQAVARELGLQASQVRRLVDAAVPEAGVLRRAGRTASQACTDEELTKALREAARELRSPLTLNTYRRWAQQRSNGRPCPSAEVIVARFGSWRRALVRAGLPSTSRHGPLVAYDYATVVQAVAAAWREIRRYPSTVRYDAWRAARRHLPSAAAARSFATSWDDLLADAYPLVYGADPGGASSAERSPRTDKPAQNHEQLGAAVWNDRPGR